jgi:hypothetical protein
MTFTDSTKSFEGLLSIVDTRDSAVVTQTISTLYWSLHLVGGGEEKW